MKKTKISNFVARFSPERDVDQFIDSRRSRMSGGRVKSSQAPLPELDYSPDSMSYELVDAINKRFGPSKDEIVSREVFGQ